MWVPHKKNKTKYQKQKEELANGQFAKFCFFVFIFFLPFILFSDSRVSDRQNSSG